MLLPFLQSLRMNGLAHGHPVNDYAAWGRKRKAVDLSDITPLEVKIVEHVVSSQVGRELSLKARRRELTEQFNAAELIVRRVVFEFYKRQLAEEEAVITMLMH